MHTWQYGRPAQRRASHGVGHVSMGKSALIYRTFDNFGMLPRPQARAGEDIYGHVDAAVLPM